MLCEWFRAPIPIGRLDHCLEEVFRRVHDQRSILKLRNIGTQISAPSSWRGFLLLSAVPEDGMTEYPDLDTAKLMLGAASIVLGEDHAATLALARAVTTRWGADTELSRLALRRIPRDQRRAIADLVETAWEAEAV